MLLEDNMDKIKVYAVFYSEIIFDDDFIFENIQRTRCTDKMGSYKEK